MHRAGLNLKHFIKHVNGTCQQYRHWEDSFKHHDKSQKCKMSAPVPLARKKSALGPPELHVWLHYKESKED